MVPRGSQASWTEEPGKTMENGRHGRIVRIGGHSFFLGKSRDKALNFKNAFLIFSNSSVRLLEGTGRLFTVISRIFEFINMKGAAPRPKQRQQSNIRILRTLYTTLY